MEARGTVAQVSSKDVKTKFGMKQTYSFKLDNGNWYSTAFKSPGVSVGDVVYFHYIEDKYGNQVDPSGIAKTGTAPLPASGAATPTLKTYPTQPSGGKGVFPIPALDGQRAIVRQNALTNARETVVQLIVNGSSGEEIGRALDVPVANRIVDMARIFEAYSCGDSDMQEAQAAVDEMSKS